MQNPHEDRREQDCSEQLQAVSVSEKQSSSVEQSEFVVESIRLRIETISDFESDIEGGGHDTWALRVSGGGAAWFSPSSSTL